MACEPFLWMATSSEARAFFSVVSAKRNERRRGQRPHPMLGISHAPLLHKHLAFILFMRALFANKKNSTAEGWGSGAQCLCMEPELSSCVQKKVHTNIYYLVFRWLKIIFLCFKKQTSITQARPSLPAEPRSERASGNPAPLAP
jgi:hypothetical protein